MMTNLNLNSVRLCARSSLIIAALMTAVALGGCSKPAAAPGEPGAKRYPLKGKVVSVDRDKHRATIDHESVPGYMDAMTMDFPIYEDWVWDELSPGSEIRAELVVDNSAKDPYWLEKIAIVASPVAGQPAIPVNENFAQIGKEVPDFALTDQDGNQLSFSAMRGKAIAVTFIYRECPLPDYCIRMSRHFSDIANELARDPQNSQKFALVSISFDPERDTPEKLRSYGLGYLGKDSKADFSIWKLAVGSDKEIRAMADFFGLRYEKDPNDKTQIIHSLVTAVIGPDGKVTKIFKGNEWTPTELLAEMKRAAG